MKVFRTSKTIGRASGRSANATTCNCTRKRPRSFWAQLAGSSPNDFPVGALAARYAASGCASSDIHLDMCLDFQTPERAERPDNSCSANSGIFTNAASGIRPQARQAVSGILIPAHCLSGWRCGALNLQDRSLLHSTIECRGAPPHLCGAGCPVRDSGCVNQKPHIY